MGWNGMSGNQGQGFHATAEAKDEAVRIHNEQFEKENASWLLSSTATSFAQRVREYVEEVPQTVEEATDNIDYFLMRGEEDGVLPQMMQILKDEGLATCDDPQVQSAALEEAYRSCS